MKMYTAFDIIRLVQDVISTKIAELDAEESYVLMEAERGIVASIMMEEEWERDASSEKQ